MSDDLLTKPRDNVWVNPRCSRCGVRAQLNASHLCEQCKEKQR